MKKKYVITTVLIAFVILLVFISILLVGLFSFKQYILAVELEDPPENFINISETEIQNYPTLKKAVEDPGKDIEITSYENHALLDLFDSSTTNIRYLDNYFQILWST